MTFMQNSVWRNRFLKDMKTYDIAISPTNQYKLQVTTKQMVGVPCALLVFALLKAVNFLHLAPHE